MAFVHLHDHSDFSLLDGAQKVKAIAKKAKELGQNAIALTDHGSMAGAIELYKACQNEGIKPIIGNEMYILVAGGSKKHHLTVLAKDMSGYRNLCALTSYSYIKGMNGSGIYKRPCITKDLLKIRSEGLIVLSGCSAGEVPNLILQGKLDEARESARWFKDVFGEDYYLEIQDHGFRGKKSAIDDKQNDNGKVLNDAVVNQELIKIGNELNIKVVATNDAHFTCADDWGAQTALLCINTNSLLNNPKMKYTGTEYLKSEQEMLELFRDHLDDFDIVAAINTTQEIADKVQPYDGLLLKEGDKSRMPKFDTPNGENSEQYLRELTLNKLGDRFEHHIPMNYMQRLNLELDVICSKGFADYFLVVWDYCDYACKNGIPTGSGRGSAAGSIVAYALGITNIDPIHHGLLFERFLNPERMSMPDIDTDFEHNGRAKVLEYVRNKYKNVAQIATFGSLQSKSALKDVFRVMDLPYSDSQNLADKIPVSRGKPTKLKEMIGDNSPSSQFRDAYLGNELFREAIDIAIKLEGTNKSAGVHAAGVVIAPENIEELIPLQTALDSDGNVVTVAQYSMENIEAMGLLKMDFLGLKTLTQIDKCLKTLAGKGINLDPDEITYLDKSFHPEWGDNLPEDVAKAYQMLTDGKNDGVFQLESGGISDKVKSLQPDSIDTISAISALYRPGPLDEGITDEYINRKLGKSPITYELPQLEPILQDTYGCMVYQEQIMKIAQVLANYSLAEADLLRRAMGKKKPAEMQKQRSRFMSGSLGNNIDENIANRIFDGMTKFAEYCFNKSHSVAYSYVTWQTAYLKANYPSDFMAALLSCEFKDNDKISKYILSAREMGVKVLLPDINLSEVDFIPNKDGDIVFGLAAIKGLGEDIAKRIVEERQNNGAFKSLGDFCDRVVVSAKSFTVLIHGGAFDGLIANRQQAINNIEARLKTAKRNIKAKESGQLSLFSSLEATEQWREKPSPEYDAAEKIRLESEVLGICLGESPMDRINPNFKKITWTIKQALNHNWDDNLSVLLLVSIDSIREFVVKKPGPNQGRDIAEIGISDESGKMTATAFPGIYEAERHKIAKGRILLLGGRIDKSKKSLVIDRVAVPEDSMEITLVSSGGASDARKLLSEAFGTKPSGSHLVISVYAGNIINIGTYLFWVNNGSHNSDLATKTIAIGELEEALALFDAFHKLAGCTNWQEVQELIVEFEKVSPQFYPSVWAIAPKPLRKGIKEFKGNSQ